jgi:curli biogenesis system outer membrane secretion channel CsgG
MRRRSLLSAGLCALAAAGLGCGYRLAGKADTMPKSVQTLAIPAFRNATLRYRLSERMPAAIAEEFIKRTRYQIVSDPDQADALLEGSITQYNAWPSVFDPATNRASMVQVSLYLDIRLVERATGKVLFSRNRWEFRERYEISIDERAYFDESDAAMERLSRDVARTLVSGILEDF